MLITKETLSLEEIVDLCTTIDRDYVSFIRDSIGSMMYKTFVEMILLSNFTPTMLHHFWCQEMKKYGWIQGEDVSKKHLRYLIPYNNLPLRIQIEYQLLVATVKTLSPIYNNTPKAKKNVRSNTVQT